MYDPVNLPPNVSPELADRIAKARINQYQKEYRQRNPEKYHAQRVRTYVRFLEKEGYKVIAPQPQEGGET